MKTLVIACSMVVFCLPAFAASPVLDNERVTVWDMALSKGAMTPPTPANLDSVTMFVEGGTVSTRNSDGTVSTATRKFGDAVFNPKGSNKVDTAESDGIHEVVVALKDFDGFQPKPGPAGIPNSFPRSGAEKTLEGDRFRVWRFSWIPNTAVPMHYHNNDLVMAFRYNGTLRSSPLNGTPTDIPEKIAKITFSKAGLTHTETLIGEQLSVVDLELK
jgi:hypothetical protein